MPYDPTSPHQCLHKPPSCNPSTHDSIWDRFRLLSYPLEAHSTWDPARHCQHWVFPRRREARRREASLKRLVQYVRHIYHIANAARVSYSHSVVFCYVHLKCGYKSGSWKSRQWVKVDAVNCCKIRSTAISSNTNDELADDCKHK